MGTLCTQLRLSLTELDRRFSYLMEGRAYHGEAINPRGLSVWERLTRIDKVSFSPPAQLLSLQRCCGLWILPPLDVRQCNTDIGAPWRSAAVIAMPRDSCCPSATLTQLAERIWVSIALYQ